MGLKVLSFVVLVIDIIFAIIVYSGMVIFREEDPEANILWILIAVLVANILAIISPYIIQWIGA